MRFGNRLHDAAVQLRVHLFASAQLNAFHLFLQIGEFGCRERVHVDLGLVAGDPHQGGAGGVCGVEQGFHRDRLRGCFHMMQLGDVVVDGLGQRSLRHRQWAGEQQAGCE